MKKSNLIYDWALKMLKEIEKHATEEKCSDCIKLINNMAEEAKAKYDRK